MKGNCSFTRSERLRGHLTFEFVRKKAKPQKGRYLTIHTLPNKLFYSRLGISVGKRAIPKSVERNRIKRLIREAFRVNKSKIIAPQDITIRVKPIKGKLSQKNVQKELLDVFKKSNIIKK